MAFLARQLKQCDAKGGELCFEQQGRHDALHEPVEQRDRESGISMRRAIDHPLAD
jgi:hypothetical protein